MMPTETEVQDEILALEAGALQALIDEGGAVFVDIWASWCGPCRGMKPIFAELAKQLGERISFVTLEISNAETPQNDKWVERFGVRSVPTFILFKDGDDIAGFSGTATHVQMEEWLVKQLGGSLA